MTGSYITIMIESLEQKSGALDEIEAIDKAETKILNEEKPDLEAFEANMDKKDALIKKLDQLDEGFEATYAKVKKELVENKAAHADEIKKVQELIRVITEKTVRIEAAENRNKELLKNKFHGHRKALKIQKNTVRAANAYSDNMRKINKIDSFFVDDKK